MRMRVYVCETFRSAFLYISIISERFHQLGLVIERPSYVQRRSEGEEMREKQIDSDSVSLLTVVCSEIILRHRE